MREARRQHPRLAGARARQNQEGAVQRLDRRPLLGVQPVEIAAHAAGASVATGRTPRIWAMA